MNDEELRKAVEELSESLLDMKKRLRQDYNGAMAILTTGIAIAIFGLVLTILRG
jgi:Flp pilus assembly protein TadG